MLKILQISRHGISANTNVASRIATNAKTIPDKVRSHSYSVEFLNAQTSLKLFLIKPIPTVNNYFIGNDKSKWASDCKIYQGVTFKNFIPELMFVIM